MDHLALAPRPVDEGNTQILDRCGNVGAKARHTSAVSSVDPSSTMTTSKLPIGSVCRVRLANVPARSEARLYVEIIAVIRGAGWTGGMIER